MKKFLSLLIVLTMLVSSFVMPVFANEDEENLDVNFMYNFGLLGDINEVALDDIYPDDPITRLDFANIFYSIIFENQSEEYTGNLYFTDVPKEKMQVVSTVYDLGIMKGYSDTVFGANDTITYNQAVKAIVSFLGYDSQALEYGGFPVGYNIQASILGILPDANVPGDAEVTVSMVATMFKKALGVDYCTTDGYDKVPLKNVNYLSYFKDIKTTSGVVTANYLTNVKGDKAVDYFSVNVNGVRMEVTKTAHGIQELLGHDVYVYYKESGTKKSIIFFEEGKNSSLKINAKDIVSMSGDTSSRTGTITYYTNTGKGTKTQKFHTGITLLYNGTAYRSYNLNNLNMFDAPDNYDGYVELVDAGDDGTYDYIIVKAYKTHVIKSARDGVYYGQFDVSATPSENDKVFDLTEYKERNINILDISGGIIRDTDLKVGQVINVFRDLNGNIREIVASVASADVKIEGVSYNGDRIDYVIVGGENFYTSNSFSVNGRFDQAAFDAVKPGVTVTLHMNYDGEIAVIDTEKHAVAGYSYGFLIDAGREGTQLDNSILLKLLATDNKVYTYNLAEKVRFNDTSSNSEAVYAELLKGFDGTVGERVRRQVILYTLLTDSDGNEFIDAIKIAKMATDTDSDGDIDFKNEFYQFPGYTVGKEDGYYEGGMATANGKYLVNVDTMGIAFPSEEERDDESKYAMFTVERTTMGSKGSATSLREMQLYGTSENGILVKILAVNDVVSGGTAPGEKTPVVTIESVEKALDGNDNPRLKITGVSMWGADDPPRKITFYVDEKILGEDGGATTNQFIDLNGDGTLTADEKEFAPGDVFKFPDFGANMTIDTLCFRQIYDYDTKSLKPTGGRTGNKGYYYEDSNSFQMGRVVAKDGTAIRIAFENDNNGTTTNYEYQKEVYELSSGYYRFVEVTKNPRTGAISVGVVSPEKIYPEDTFPLNPSKVLIQYRGNGIGCIIFNGDMADVFR